MDKPKFFSRKFAPNFWSILGFATLAVIALALATCHFWDLPRGLSPAEIASITVSGNFSFHQLFANFSAHISELANLPWTIIQHFATNLFGFSTFALRLPSVILTLLAVGLLVVSVAKWLRPGLAIVAGFAVVTSTWFFGLARAGDGASLTVFWLSLMIFLATQILVNPRGGWRSTVYKIVLGVAGALLIYAPGGIYFAIILALAAALHPKSRLIFWRLKLWKILVGIFVGLLIISPLILGIFLQFRDGNFVLFRELFLLNYHFTFANLQNLGTSFFALKTGFAGGFILPTLSVATLLVALFGFAEIARDIFSARAYLVLSLLIISLILSWLNPEFLGLLIVPFAFGLGVGFLALIELWYRFFPRNIFAKVLAAVMLVALVVGAGWLDVSRTLAAQNYSVIPYNYNQEFAAARSVISRNKNEKVLLIAPQNQQDFYQILIREFPKLRVENSVDFAKNSAENYAKNDTKNANEKLIIVNSANAKIDQISTEIITNSLSRNSVLVRVY